jgi:predicted Rossmann fold nucleotide-binding protein DprA/Smf involved in DNA uptake
METIELTKTAQEVLTVINGTGPDAVNWETIQALTKMERMSVFSGLLELELYGIIKQLPGKFFIREGEVL